MAVRPAQPSAAATRPMAIVWPAARMEANACPAAGQLVR